MPPVILASIPGEGPHVGVGYGTVSSVLGVGYETVSSVLRSPLPRTSPEGASALSPPLLVLVLEHGVVLSSGVIFVALLLVAGSLWESE